MRIALVYRPDDEIHAANVPDESGWIATACGRRVLVFSRKFDPRQADVILTCPRCRRRVEGE